MMRPPFDPQSDADRQHLIRMCRIQAEFNRDMANICLGTYREKPRMIRVLDKALPIMWWSIIAWCTFWCLRYVVTGDWIGAAFQAGLAGFNGFMLYNNKRTARAKVKEAKPYFDELAMWEAEIIRLQFGENIIDEIPA